MPKTIPLVDNKARPSEIAHLLSGVEITALRKVGEDKCNLQWHNNALRCKTRSHNHSGGTLKLNVHSVHNKGLIEKDPNGYFSITQKGKEVLKILKKY